MTTAGQGVTVTQPNAMGYFEITAVTNDGHVDVTFHYDGVTEARKFVVTRNVDAPPPPGDHAIGKSVNADIAYGNIPTLIAIGAINADTAGKLKCIAALRYLPAAVGDPQTRYATLSGKFAYNAGNGWVDAGAFATGLTGAAYYTPTGGTYWNEGALSFEQSITGLAPNTPLQIALYVRNNGPALTLGVSGNVIAEHIV